MDEFLMGYALGLLTVCGVLIAVMLWEMNEQ